MKPFYLFCMLGFLIGAFSIPAWGLDSPQPLPSSCAFQATRVIEIRSLVQRAGWNDSTLDAQAVPTDSPEQKAWTQAVRAALLGGRDRTTTALRQADQALESRANLSSLPPSAAFLLLKTCDVLMAIPEFNSLESSDVESFRMNLAAYAQVVDGALWDESKPDLHLHALAARLYAAGLTGNRSAIELYWRGDAAKPGLWSEFKKSFSSEGWMDGVSLPDQCFLWGDLFHLLRAMKAWSVPDAEIWLPWLRCSTDFLYEMLALPVYPAAAILEDPPVRENVVRIFEEGYGQFGDSALGLWLKRHYENTPRMGESLLLGAVSLDKILPLPLEHDLSTLFPRAGAAVLKDVTSEIPLSVYVDSGFLSRLGDSALGAVEISAGAGSRMSLDPALSPLAYNTVLLNRRSQDPLPPQGDNPRNALVTQFVPFSGVGGFLSLSASGLFGERAAYSALSESPIPDAASVYQRDLYLASPYLVDLFRVLSAGVQDWVYRSASPIAKDDSLEFKPYAAPSDEYPFLQSARNVESAEVKGVYSIQLGNADAPLRERLWFVDPAGSTLLLAPHDSETLLIHRRSFTLPQGNLFACVHEWIASPAASAPPTRLIPLPLEPMPNERGFQAVAFALERGDVHDLFFSALRPDIVYTTRYLDKDVVFAGKFGHIRWKQKECELLRLIEGTELRIGPVGLKLPAAVGSGILQTVREDEGEMNVHFTPPLPEGATLLGQVVQAVSSQPGTVYMQPFPLRRLSPYAPTQTMKRLRPVSLAGALPPAAAPLQPGDQLLFSSYAELQYRGDNWFSLMHTTPVEVQIQGPPFCNRIYLDKSYVQHLRGKLEKDSITFQVLPEESLNGKMDFHRIP